jgi:hypothetical protein
VTLVNGINDVTAYPRLIESVIRRGATDVQVRKLLGENILCVWAENEAIAKRLQDADDKSQWKKFGKEGDGHGGIMPYLLCFPKIPTESTRRIIYEERGFRRRMDSHELMS